MVKSKLHKLSFFKYIIPAFGVFGFIIQIIIFIRTKHFYSPLYFYSAMCLFSISLCACIFLLFFPNKMFIYGIVAFVYTIVFTFIDVNEIDIVLCFLIMIVSLWNQGILERNKKKCFAFFFFLTAGIITARSFIFKKEYISRLIYLWPYLFTISIIFFFSLNAILLYKRNMDKAFINLDLYDNLSERQKNLILCILNNEKYETFAQENKISLSSVKKDAVTIFKTFNSFDRYTFILKYASFDFYRNGKRIFLGTTS